MHFKLSLNWSDAEQKICAMIADPSGRWVSVAFHEVPTAAMAEAMTELVNAYAAQINEAISGLRDPVIGKATNGANQPGGGNECS